MCLCQPSTQELFKPAARVGARPVGDSARRETDEFLPFWAGAVWHGYACFELPPEGRGGQRTDRHRGTFGVFDLRGQRGATEKRGSAMEKRGGREHNTLQGKRGTRHLLPSFFILSLSTRALHNCPTSSSLCLSDCAQLPPSFRYTWSYHSHQPPMLPPPLPSQPPPHFL